MAIDFPNSPSLNDSHTVSGKTWVYNGSGWVLVGNPTAIPNGAITASMLTDMGASAGQVMQWDGSAWVGTEVTTDVMTDTKNAAIITMEIGA